MLDPWPHALYYNVQHCLHTWAGQMVFLLKQDPRAPSQYPKRLLSVRSRKVSKPRDLYLELSDRYEIWQALWQQCCRCACQISKRYHNLKYQSRGFEILRDLTKRRLFGYWDGAQVTMTWYDGSVPILVFPPISGGSMGPMGPILAFTVDTIRLPALAYTQCKVCPA